jgi:hypothetical protein
MHFLIAPVFGAGKQTEKSWATPVLVIEFASLKVIWLQYLMRLDISILVKYGVDTICLSSIDS